MTLTTISSNIFALVAFYVGSLFGMSLSKKTMAFLELKRSFIKGLSWLTRKQYLSDVSNKIIWIRGLLQSLFTLQLGCVHKRCLFFFFFWGGSKFETPSPLNIPTSFMDDPIPKLRKNHLIHRFLFSKNLRCLVENYHAEPNISLISLAIHIVTLQLLLCSSF